MSLRYALICFVLFLVVIFLAERSYNALTHPLELVPDKGGSKNEAKPGNPPAIEIPKERPAIASYNVIAARNIFNPERKDFVAVGPGMSAKPMVRPQVILYGVTIAGDYRSASVVNPGRSLKKGEREQMTIKLGERIGEYRLAKVLSDRITMEAGEDTFEVFLYDPKAPKKRVDTRTESKPATIISTQAPSTPRDDVKGGSVLPKDLGIPPSIQATKPVIPKETAGETKGPSAETPTPMTPPGTTVPPPGTAPTATQVPVPMAATPVPSQFSPTPLAVPPGMGTGKPVPLPPGASPTGGK
jgi:hypothetical protein